MEIIDLLRSHANYIKASFAVKRIGLFGSFARGEQKASSDIDILVEFEKPTFRNFMNLSFYLEDLFGQRGGSSHRQRVTFSYPAVCGEGCDLV